MTSDTSSAENEKPFVAKKWPQVYVTMAGSSGGISFGCVLAWTSSSLPSLSDSQDLGVLENTTRSWIASLTPLFAALGALMGGVFMQAFGRRNCLIVIQIPFLLGWLVMAYAQNFNMILVGRVVTGYTCGLVSVIVPVLIAESVEKNIRGLLCLLFPVLTNFGIWLTYIMGKWLSWRNLSLACGAVPLLTLVMLVWIPESPRYLVSKNRMNEAIRSLLWLRGTREIEYVNEEFTEIEQGVHEKKARKVSFRDFLDGSVLKPVGMVLAVMFFQRLSGINAMLVYTVDIFRDSGSGIDPHWSTVIFGTCQLFSSSVSAILIERIGRRLLLAASGLFSGIAMAAMGTYFHLKANGDEGVVDSISWLPLVSLVLYILTFAVGYGPIPWTLVGELLPNHVIGPASALAIGWTWILAFLITRFFDDINRTIGSNWCFWIFSIFLLISSVFAFVVLPETKGKSLEQIQNQFQKHDENYNVQNIHKVVHAKSNSPPC